jgi:putative salt-induced outer membrane protein
MNKVILVMSAGCLLSLNAMASEEPNAITGSSELGLLFKSGNTKSTDLKAGVDLHHSSGLWKNSLLLALLAKKAETIDAVSGEKDFATNDQKWSMSAQSDYTINAERKDYAWGNVSYEDDRFSSFNYQSSYAAGWGKRWLETKTSWFDAEIGAGYKIDEKLSGDQEKSVIIRLAAAYEKKLFEAVTFKQTFSANISPDSDENSKYKAISSITSKLMESLALKFSLTIDYNTEVAQGSNSTDTETALTLVYSF